MDKRFPGYRIHPVYQQRVKTYMENIESARQPEEVEIAPPTSHVNAVSAVSAAAPTSASLRNKKNASAFSGAVKSDNNKGVSYSIKLAIASGALHADSC
jgi:hypothetical protein